MMQSMGQPWWVEWNDVYGNADLVIPKPFRADATAPIASDAWTERWQLVLLGMAYNVTTGAGPLGIIIYSVDGDGTQQRIYEISSAATGIISAGFPCYIELSPGGAASPISDPARLRVELVGSVVTANLLLWGVHSPASGKKQLGFATPPISFT